MTGVMTAITVVYGVILVTVGGILAVVAHRDLTQAQARAQLNADTLAHIRWLAEAEDFADWEREYREVES